MPVKPQGSILTVDGNAVRIADVRFTTDIAFFSRMEFSNERLRSALNVDGSKPVFVELLGGKLTQYSNGCNPNDTVRPLGPDDANYDDIYRRFDIKRWEIAGASSLPANVESIFLLARDHRVLLARFDAHIQKARANISYSALIAMQAVTFSYLTTTGISMSGMALGVGAPTTVTDILITAYTPGVDYEEPSNVAGTTSIVRRSWTLTVEQRIERPALSTIY